MDGAEEAMNHINITVADRGASTKMQQSLASEANQKLANMPWWPDFGDTLKTVFGDHFRYQTAKITYYPEVDSWSVMLPEPSSPLAMTPSHLEGVIVAVADRLYAKH
jgi:hypothetical protein